MQTIKILGVAVTDGLSVSPHVHSVIASCTLTLYALRVLRAHGLRDCAPQTVSATELLWLLNSRHLRLDRFSRRQTTAKRSQLLFDAANALASVQVNLTTSVVYVTPVILNYLLRFYIIPAMSYKHYSLRQQITT